MGEAQVMGGGRGRRSAAGHPPGSRVTSRPRRSAAAPPSRAPATTPCSRPRRRRARRRGGVGVPGALDRRGDHPRAEPATPQRGIGDEVVELDGAFGHVDDRLELGEVLRVVADHRALQQPDRVAVERHDEVLSRLFTLTLAPKSRSTASAVCSWFHHRATSGSRSQSASRGRSAAVNGRQVRAPSAIASTPAL
jgi:hypothetical protein